MKLEKAVYLWKQSLIFLLNFWTDLHLWRSWSQEILQKVLNSSPRTALELKSNDKRPFFYIYHVVFPFIPSQHLKSCDHLLLLKTCLFTFSVLPWINKNQLQFETNAKVLFVWSPTWLWKAGKIMFYNQNLNVFALVLKWWLSFLTIIFMLI